MRLCFLVIALWWIDIVIASRLRFKLLRISPIDGTVLKFLDNYNALQEKDGIVPADIWFESRVYDSVDVLLNSHHLERVLKSLQTLGTTNITVLSSNGLQRQMELEKRRRQRRRRNVKSLSERWHFHVFDYNSYEEMIDYMNNLSNKFTQFVRLLNITRTFQGRELVGVKIGKESLNRKPMIYIDGGLHAREWIAPAAALYFIDRLTSVLANTSTVKTDGYRLWNKRFHKIVHGLLDKFDFIVIPVANPDGYAYSMTKNRLWRKTRSRGNLTQQCVGTDANRNWGYRWGGDDRNHSPCSSVFGGAHAFSEPETAGLRDFVGRQARKITVYISLHAYGQMLLAPWGWTSDKPLNYENQHDAANRAISAIQNATGAIYTFGTIAEMMYQASGTSIDYMHHAGVPYVYGMELQPADTAEGALGFLAPVEAIEPSGIELIAVLDGIAEHINAIENKSNEDMDPI